MKRHLPALAFFVCCIAPTFAQDRAPQNAIAPDTIREVQGENATPDNPRPANALSVRDFGARGDAQTDDTAAFRAALDAASTRGGGNVFVPAGQYRINGTLDIPAGITLEGTWRGPHTSQLSIGTTLLAYSGRGDENATPFLSLHAGSTLKGATIFYPEQKFSLPPPQGASREAPFGAPAVGLVPYPWTIQGRGQQFNVIDTTIVNAWNGIDCGSFHNEGHLLRNILMCTLRRGVLVDQNTDVGRLDNVHIHAVYWWRANAPGVPLQEQATFFSGEQINALNAFTQANLEGFIFGRCDWEYVNNSFVIWAKTGMKFVHTDTPVGGEPNVLLTQSGADISIYAARVLATQEHAGISFTNAQMDGIVKIEDTNRGPVKFTNCAFYGSGSVDSNIISDGRGRVSFDNCHFAWWDQNENDAPAIRARGGVLGVANSEFQLAENHIVLEKKVRAATILGNYFRGAMRLENRSAGNVQIGLNADSPPPPPAVLTRRFFSGFESGQPQPFLNKPEIVAHRGAYSLNVENGGRGESGRALVLRGNAVDTSKEPARAYFRIFEGKMMVRPNTVLRYWIRPDDAEARHAGIDLVFDDGTALRDSGARDGQGNLLHPSQPKGELGKWTRIESPIGKWAAGKTIIAILAAHDGFGGDAFRVSFDDLEIGDTR